MNSTKSRRSKNIALFCAQSLMQFTFDKIKDFLDFLLKFLCNKHTLIVLKTITEISLAVSVFLILSIATCILTIIVNVNDACNKKQSTEEDCSDKEMRLCFIGGHQIVD